MRNAGQFAEYGLIGPAPRVDFEKAVKRTQHIIYKLHEKKQLIQHLESSGIEVHTDAGQASFMDPNTLRLETGLKLHADKVILCVGGHARRLNFPGAEYALTHSDVWSLTELPRSLAIVGGAATGCQLATIFNAFGTKVTLLDIAPQLLPAEDQAISQAMTEAFKARGIEPRTDIQGIDRIEKVGDALLVHFQAEGSQSMEVEAAIQAVGWIGNLDDLNLEAAGLHAERGYLPVDDSLATSVPHIFAAGDVTGRMMLVQSASHDARLAAENAVLGAGQPYKRLITPHGGFTDPEYGSVGHTEATARELEPDCLVATVQYAELDRAVIDGHPEGFCKLIVSAESHRILGAHVVGEHAVEVVQLVAASMAGGIWVEQLSEVELAYPTYLAIVGLAARRLVEQLGVVPLAPEWRALGRPHAAEWERRD
jgi:dihydrolipoamide dehydrogenase